MEAYLLNILLSPKIICVVHENTPNYPNKLLVCFHFTKNKSIVIYFLIVYYISVGWLKSINNFLKGDNKMLEKIVLTHGTSEYHLDGITESTGLNVSGPIKDYVYVSESHSNSKNITFIGEFTFEDDIVVENNSPLFNQITYKKKTYNYQIYIYDSEGPIPHFHVVDITNNSRSGNGNRYKDVCICIYSANYFSHGKHDDKFNNKELKALDSFLRTSLDQNNTKWDYIRLVWKNNNPDMVQKYPQYYLSENDPNNKPIQPDYTNITSFVQNPRFY